MDIGFIGLGRMGSGMARSLLKAGHQLTVYNRTRKKAEALAEAGVRVVASPAEAACHEILITMLTGDDAVEATLVGAHGALPALARDAIHLGMSTISPALSERLAREHAAAQQHFVAAPVLGRPEAAEAAELFVIAAGSDAAVARCQPVFDSVGKRSFIIGDEPARANLVKLSINFLIASMLEALGEAFALVRKSGIEPQRYLTILTETLFAAPVYKTYGRMIAEQHYEPAAFNLLYGLKDMRLALDAASARSVPMPIASVIAEHMLEGIASGRSKADWAQIAETCARHAGLKG